MPISAWSTTPASNNSAPPNGAPEGMAPSSVNDIMRQQMADHKTQWLDAEWFNHGDTVSRASATTFKIASDATARYLANRRIKCYDGSTLYGTISNSSYSAPDTTVTVSLDSGSLTSSLSSVALAILTPTNQSIPPFTSLSVGGTFTASGASVFKTNLTVEGTATVSGAAVMKTTLTVEGASTLSATAVCKTGLVVEGSVATIKGNSTQSGRIELLEDTDNGTNKVTIAAPAAITSDRTVTLPDRDLTSSNFVFEYISSTTASSTATVDFTNLSSSYIMYMFLLTYVTPATDLAELWVRMDLDNGASFDAGASDYKYAGQRLLDNAATTLVQSSGAAQIEIATDVGNGGAESCSGRVYIYNPMGSAGKYPFIDWYMSTTDGSGFSRFNLGSGIKVSNSTGINALRFLFSSGDIASGAFTLYGLRGS